MTAHADPFITFVLAQDSDVSDDLRQDLEDGWTFNPDRIPGTIALYFRMVQLGACDEAVRQFWGHLTQYTADHPYIAEDILSVLAYGADYFRPLDLDADFDGGPSWRIESLLIEMTADGDWVSVR